jgi:peroxiredoxin
LAGYRDRFAELQALGVGLVALSVDPPETSRALAAQLGLPFPLLSDTRRQVLEAYGVLNRREKGGIAYPATFALSRERVVRFRSLDRTVTRVDLGALVAFLHGGLDRALAETPRRSRVRPTAHDVLRMARNAIQRGVRSPRP